MNQMNSVTNFNYDQEVTHIITRIVQDGLRIARTEGNTKIFASLVPDEIIYTERISDKEQVYNGAVLFADVSGFTDLCERYNSLGKGGPSRITQVLNAYIGAMVQEIISHNGDILKFSGDAFLALWKSKDSASMPDVVHAAIDCALGIQRSHGSYKTEVGITLRVKIAIAAGQVIFTVIGDSNFMILGSTIFDVKNVGNLCNPGEVIISATVKSFLNSNEYIFEAIPNVPQSTKIKGIGSDWSPSQLSNQYEIFDTPILDTENDNKKLAKSSSNLSLTVDDDEYFSTAYSYNLRPSLDFAVNKNMKDFLRKFIIAPVVRVIDLNEPLEYLTEMRQVVIVFINVVTLPVRLKELSEVCDTTYSIILRIVNEREGCVNKVSMFDKDLMFLVIFGLRGFKHILEAQRALSCAKHIRDDLIHVHGVASASIGVTSGVTYCGVVGHPMRREYTVIGRTVNKAARLMVAYPDKVTCDRQTFLHSQLQARHFKLQPIRYLKGFRNVGPIYEFNDESGDEEVILQEMTKTSRYPLLDRPKEMEILYHFLQQIINPSASLSLLSDMSFHNNEYRMLVVKGAARQGKTRLLNEIAFFIPNGVPFLKSTLTSKDKKSPYKVIRSIYNDCCGLTDEKNINIRTKKIANILQPFLVPEFMCALNEILDVNFEVTKYYLRLNNEKRSLVQCKMIKYLSIKCFKSMCLITIDNIEYMDDESWKLLKVMLDTGTIFMCVTLRMYTVACPESALVLERDDVITLELQPIHEWYHAGLICQFLNVKGVPLELEKYIQVHSNGNPGWIESFLATLQHSENLEVHHIDEREAQEAGLVMPPADMLTRESSDVKNYSMSALNLVETIESSDYINIFDLSIEGWDIYRQTIKESIADMSHKTTQKIPICILPNQGQLDDTDTEDVLDVQMMRTYDSLNIQEQQLLKCSSILGDSFSRVMLGYVMQNQNVRKTAIAIQKLFEIHVFSCARGVYQNGHIQRNHHLFDPNKDDKVKCECEGFPIDMVCMDLPKYASCGYIRYRQPKFRQILYNLLTDNQSTLYHIRAIWFLESETRKCRACGLGYFTQLIGQVNDDGMKHCSVDNIPSLTEIDINSRLNYSIETVTIEEDDDDFNPLFDNMASRSSTEFKKTPAASLKVPKFTTTTLVYGPLKARTFAENNLAKCECNLILTTMYDQIIEHCQEACMDEKLMYALLEYATLCIKHHNITVAFTLLERAKILLDKLKTTYLEPAWQVPIAMGRIMCLHGQLHIERDDYEQAERSLHAALRCYNLRFPKNIVAINTMINIMEIKQKMIIEYFSQVYIGSKNEDQCTLAEQTSEVLSALYTVYRRTCQYKKGYLASVWSLNEALRSDSNFLVMCAAYGNMISMDMYRSRPRIISKIEEMALAMCYRKHTRLEVHELEAVMKLYGAIFCRKCLCENVMNSLTLGYIVIQLNSPQYGGNYKWLMLPLLLKALIKTHHIAQAANFVKQIDHLIKINGDYFAPMMYYTLCIEFRLDTTYSIVPFEACKSHVIVRVNKYARRLMSTIEMRYHISLWLWYIRKREWHSAANLYSHVCQTTQWAYIDDPTMIHTMLHILEGSLLLVVKEMNMCDVQRVRTLRTMIKNIINKIKPISKKLICTIPRFFHLKAYYKMIFKKEKKAFEWLNKSVKLAQKHAVLFDYEWALFSKKVWSNQVPDDPWFEATQSEKFDADWDTLQYTEVPLVYFKYYLPDI